MAASLGPPLSAGLGYRLIKLVEVALDRAAGALEGVGARPRHLNVLSTVAASPSLSQKGLSALLGIDPDVMVGAIAAEEDLLAALTAQERALLLEPTKQAARHPGAAGSRLLSRSVPPLPTCWPP